MQHSFLFDIFIFLLAACITVTITSKFKLGSVIGYLIAGALIGPHFFKLIAYEENIIHFAEFGVVMMLFLIGLELSPASLWKMKKAVFALGGLQVFLTSLTIFTICIFFGLKYNTSIAIAISLSLSSTAVALQILHEKKLINTSLGQNSFAVLLFQDIAVIPFLILIPLLASQAFENSEIQNNLISSFSGITQTLIISVTIALLVFLGKNFSGHIFRLIAKTNLREVFTAFSLALIVGITLLMQSIGISPALGAFIAGLVLANSEYKRSLELDIEPFKGLLMGLFFISVGMGIDFDLILESPLKILICITLLVIVKFLIIYFIGIKFKLDKLQNIGFAMVLSQGGEFAFVLFQFSNQLNIIPNEIYKLLTIIVALSMLITPIMMLFYSKFIVPKFLSILKDKSFDLVADHNDIVIAGFGRFGQIISRFLLGQGIKITVLEKDPDQIDLIRKFGFKGFFGDATRLDLLKNSGVEKAKVFIIAVDNPEESLEIAQILKDEFPNVKIFARARNRRHCYDLFKLGVSYFKRETFDSSLNMAQDIMFSLGYNKEEVEQKAMRFKFHDDETLVKSFEFFENEPELVNFAKTKRAELNDILKNTTTEK